MTNLESSLERVRYWQGQLLAAGDLRQQLATDAELRRLHAASAHRATGVAIGLSVSIAGESVAIAPGLAYDCASRPLILTSARPIALPGPGDGGFVLTILADPAATTGVALRWRRASEWDPREGIALARVTRSTNTAGAVTIERDDRFRPTVARPLARPNTVQGQTIPGETTWQPWMLGGTEVGVQVRVDTSGAGFTATPHYFATAVAGQVDETLAPAWFASVGRPDETGFTLRLLLRGIAVQSLTLADPLSRVSKTNRLDEIDLVGPAALKVEDQVVRLLPVVQDVAVVTSISDGVASLQGPEPSLNPAGWAGLYLLPRMGTVASTSDIEKTALVDISNDATITADSTLWRLGSVVPEGLARVVRRFGAVLELDQAIANLEPGDRLGVVRNGSRVAGVKERDVTVDDTKPFEADDFVFVRAKSFVAQVVKINGDEKILTLDRDVPELGRDPQLEVVRGATATVQRRPAGVQRRRVTLEAPLAPFRMGDLVTHPDRLGPSQPAVIQGIDDASLLLQGTIPDLAADDPLGAATFGVRATVRSVAQQGQSTVLTVDNPERFRESFVVRVGGELAELPRWVDQVTDTALTLATPPAPFRNDDVIARCDFPRFVVVMSIVSDRTVLVSAPAVLAPGDVVTAAPEASGVSFVESTNGTEVRLVTPIEGLAVGQRLAVATEGGIVQAEKTDRGIRLIAAPHVRVGDALGGIVRWRQTELDAVPASVRSLKARPDPEQPQAEIISLALSGWPDGLLSGDVLGLPSIQFPDVRMRLENMPELSADDEISVSATDATSGEVFATTGRILEVSSAAAGRVRVLVSDAEGAIGREFRPAQVTASVQFVRGSALELIRNQDLFVSWLAVEDQLPMPRTWATLALTACGCSPAKET